MGAMAGYEPIEWPQIDREMRRRWLAAVRQLMRGWGRTWVHKAPPAEVERILKAHGIQLHPDVGKYMIESAIDQARRLPLPVRARRLAETLVTMALRGERLVGWRVWGVTKEGVLQSLFYETLWESKSLQAEEYEDEHEIDGGAGIHACWCYYSEDIAWSTGWSVIGRVEGSGRYTVRPEGWHAECAEIRALWVHPERARAAGWDPEQLRQQLRRRYPGVRVGFRRV